MLFQYCLFGSWYSTVSKFGGKAPKSRMLGVVGGQEIPVLRVQLRQRSDQVSDVRTDTEVLDVPDINDYSERLHSGLSANCFALPPV